MDVGWDDDLTPDMLAEIERMERKASNKPAPSPALPQPPVVRQPLPPIVRLPPPPGGTTSSYFSSSSPQRRAVLPPPTRFLKSPQKCPVVSAAPVQEGVEDIEDFEEQLGSSSVQTASSSSPSQPTAPIEPSAPPVPTRGGAPPAPSTIGLAGRKMYSGNGDTPSSSPSRMKMVVVFAMHTRATIAIRTPVNSAKDRRDEVFRIVKQLIDCTEERDPTSKQLYVTIPVEWYPGVVDLVRSLRDLTLHLLYPAVYDIYVAKHVAPKQPVADLATLLPADLNNTLLDFQRLGVEFALRRGGRVLIGDEMGLGKTLQAIAVALCYRKEWPLLVVIPSSVRLQWAEAYVPGLLPEDVNIVFSGKDGHLKALINIVSYDILSKMDLTKYPTFKVIICDESHYLKSHDAKRTLIVVPLIQSAFRAILLSGTPALSRPKELWQQISALDTKVFGSPKQPWGYYDRYCASYRDPRFNRLISDGASNLAELHMFLQDTVMIRRLKTEVLTQLPPKRRTEVKLSLDKKTSAKIKRLEKEKEAMRARLGEADTWEKSIDASVENKGLLLELFKSTGTVKIPAVTEYVKDLCEANEKFLIFAYHHDVMDAIQQTLEAEKVEFIRIDGHTPGHHRGDYAKEFQTNPNVCVRLCCPNTDPKIQIKVAILGITAAGVGLNLYAASTVVFAELYWNPGQLQQCEDRAHRIGTTAESVNIYYLVAAGTIDTTIWQMLRKKLSVVGSTLNGAAETLTIEKTEKKAVNSKAGNGFIDTLMEELDTYDERQQAFNKRRKDRKELKAYLKIGKLPDEDRQGDQISVIGDEDGVSGVVHVDDGHFDETQRAPKCKVENVLQGTPATAELVKPLSGSLSTFNRHKAEPSATTPALSGSTAAPAPVAAPTKPLSSRLSLFAFSRPSSSVTTTAISPALNAPTVLSPKLAAPIPQSSTSFSVQSSVPALETRVAEDEALPMFVKPKRSRFIADDE